MKKLNIIILSVVIVLCLLLAVRFIFGGGEDSWIKDENGIYIEHGNPEEISEKAVNQQLLILSAMQLYYEKRDEGMIFSSQCLGVVEGYAVDIVHVPKIAEDDLKENQCEEYRNGEVEHFIELNNLGEVVRIG